MKSIFYFTFLMFLFSCEPEELYLETEKTEHKSKFYGTISKNGSSPSLDTLDNLIIYLKTTIYYSGEEVGYQKYENSDSMTVSANGSYEMDFKFKQKSDYPSEYGVSFSYTIVYIKNAKDNSVYPSCSSSDFTKDGKEVKIIIY